MRLGKVLQSQIGKKPVLHEASQRPSSALSKIWGKVAGLKANHRHYDLRYLDLNDSLYSIAKTLVSRQVTRIVTWLTMGRWIRESYLPLPKGDQQVILAYFSSKNDMNLNDEVTKKDSSGVSYEIACRHLAYAYAYAKGVIGVGEKGKKFSGIENKEALEKNEGILDETAYHNQFQFRKPRTGCYFELDKLGLALQTAVAKQQISEQTYLLGSTDHLMALKIKKGNQGDITLVFYDPNRTLGVRRIIIPSYGTLTCLDMADLIPDVRDRRLYFDEKPVSGAALVSATTHNNEDESQVDIVASRGTGALVYLLLFFGHFNEQIFSELSRSQDLEEYRRLLATKSTDGLPGLFVALQNGHDAAVKSYLKVVLGNEWPSLEDKKELLAAKRTDGIPGLFMALQDGHYAAVKSYLEAVLGDERLSREDKKELLAAKKTDGMPGLFMALQSGHYAAVKSYLEAVLGDERLSREDKKKLLAAKKVDGTPGFCMALKNRRGSVVSSFVEAVLQSNLGFDMKEELIAAKTPTGFCNWSFAGEEIICNFRRQLQNSGLPENNQKRACK